MENHQWNEKTTTELMKIYTNDVSGRELTANI